ncbi:ABC transporter substrate-binding protein, partial [Rhizobiaceae sp. 2RAB30]
PQTAVAALKAAWPSGPADAVVLKQIEETSASIPGAGEKPSGWISDKSIGDALKLLDTESSGPQKPASAFYTNEFLQN